MTYDQFNYRRAMKQGVESLVLDFLKQKDPASKYFMRNKSSTNDICACYEFQIRKKSGKWFNPFSKKVAIVESLRSGYDPTYKSFDSIITTEELKKLIPEEKFHDIIAGVLLNTAVVE